MRDREANAGRECGAQFCGCDAKYEGTCFVDYLVDSRRKTRSAISNSEPLRPQNKHLNCILSRSNVSLNNKIK